MSKNKKPLYDPKTGIHRAKLWEIALYALNNTSTNMYMLCFMYISYYLTGIVGVGVVLAGNIMMLMRMWDGVTDPLIGYVIDRTNGKFGKNRPFIFLGQVFMIIGSGLIFIVGPRLPQAARFIFFVVCYMFYVVGYTFQCVVTKSAQSCLTNDPKQRPVFSAFDTVYNGLMFMFVPIYVIKSLMPKFNVIENGEVVLPAFSNPDFFVALWMMCAGISIVFAALAIIGLWRKDRTEFFGTGKVVRLTLKDYWDVLVHNRAIQMLCVAACSDKLTMTMQSNAVVMVMLWGIVIGDYNKMSTFTAISGVFSIILPLLLLLGIARNLGQKRALLIGTYGGLIGAAIMFCMFFFGDPTQINFAPWNLYTVAFVVVFMIMRSMGGLSASIVIPMTADCADYEVYRSGRYAPGLMGTLFSFIDKMISSLATAIIGMMLATIGFTSTQPTPETPYSDGIFWVTMFLWLGAPVIGWLLNVISMKFYPLTKEKMASIQAEIAAIKARSMEEEANA